MRSKTVPCGTRKTRLLACASERTTPSAEAAATPPVQEGSFEDHLPVTYCTGTYPAGTGLSPAAEVGREEPGGGAELEPVADARAEDRDVRFSVAVEIPAAGISPVAPQCMAKNPAVDCIRNQSPIDSRIHRDVRFAVAVVIGRHHLVARGAECQGRKSPCCCGAGTTCCRTDGTQPGRSCHRHRSRPEPGCRRCTETDSAEIRAYCESYTKRRQTGGKPRYRSCRRHRNHPARADR